MHRALHNGRRRFQRDERAAEEACGRLGRRGEDGTGPHPGGRVQNGQRKSAEATAAFFNKTYGKDLAQAASFKNEHPQHRVRITKPFYLGTYHVTRGQFRQFVADTKYKTDAEKGERPGAFGWDHDKKGSTSTRNTSGGTRVSSRPTSIPW